MRLQRRRDRPLDDRAGHNPALRMVAEEMELAASRRLLRTLGRDVVQGYLLSRPLPPEQITELLHQTGPASASARRRPEGGTG